jgi:hypothetical protein
LKKFAGSLAATVGWRKGREHIEVKLARSADTGETIVLCRSADRRNKERACTTSSASVILDRLGISLPKRIRLAEHELPAFAANA